VRLSLGIICGGSYSKSLPPEFSIPVSKELTPDQLKTAVIKQLGCKELKESDVRFWVTQESGRGDGPVDQLVVPEDEEGVEDSRVASQESLANLWSGRNLYNLVVGTMEVCNDKGIWPKGGRNRKFVGVKGPDPAVMEEAREVANVEFMNEDDDDEYVSLFDLYLFWGVFFLHSFNKFAQS
jgi:hypothetical protein